MIACSTSRVARPTSRRAAVALVRGRKAQASSCAACRPWPGPCIAAAATAMSTASRHRERRSATTPPSAWRALVGDSWSALDQRVSAGRPDALSQQQSREPRLASACRIGRGDVALHCRRERTRSCALLSAAARARRGHVADRAGRFEIDSACTGICGLNGCLPEFNSCATGWHPGVVRSRRNLPRQARFSAARARASLGQSIYAAGRTTCSRAATPAAPGRAPAAARPRRATAACW
jgi:hypothetical protein